MHESLIAQWLERPTGIWEAMGSIPVGDAEVFLCPTLVTNEHIFITMILCLTTNLFSAASFHGHTVSISSHRRNSATLLPSTFMTAHMKALNPGTWLLNCMNGKFFDGGMSALFEVTDCGKGVALPSVSGGKTRTYFIAAEEVIWDYGPSGDNNIDGVSLTSPKRCIIFFSYGKICLSPRRFLSIIVISPDEKKPSRRSKCARCCRFMVQMSLR